MDKEKIANRIAESIINVIQKEDDEKEITADNLDDILSAVVTGCSRVMGAAFLAAGYNDPVGMVRLTFKAAAEQVVMIGGEE